MAIEIIVNGNNRQVSEHTSVHDLLEAMEVSTERVAVELNLDIVPRDAFAERRLRNGDSLEIVEFVGGG